MGAGGRGRGEANQPGAPTGGCGGGDVIVLAVADHEDFLWIQPSGGEPGAEPVADAGIWLGQTVFVRIKTYRRIEQVDVEILGGQSLAKFEAGGGLGIGGDAEEEAGGAGGAQAVGGPWGEAGRPAEGSVRLKKLGLLVWAELL